MDNTKKITDDKHIDLGVKILATLEKIHNQDSKNLEEAKNNPLLVSLLNSFKEMTSNYDDQITEVEIFNTLTGKLEVELEKYVMAELEGVKANSKLLETYVNLQGAQKRAVSAKILEGIIKSNDKSNEKKASQGNSQSSSLNMGK